MDEAVERKGEPSMDILHNRLAPHHLAGWQLRIHLHEDNSTAITIAATGNNQTMNTIERWHGVSIGWVHEKITR